MALSKCWNALLKINNRLTQEGEKKTRKFLELLLKWIFASFNSVFNHLRCGRHSHWLKIEKLFNIFKSYFWIVSRKFDRISKRFLFIFRCSFFSLFFFLSFSLSIVDRSTTKGKTFDPCWNEIFIHEVNNAKNIGLTVFHDAAIPPDDFVANCTIPFEDLAHRDKESQDFWVSVNFLSHLNHVG